MKEKAKSGAPPMYSDPKKMQEIIDSYFEDCEGEMWLDDKGIPLMTNKGYPIYKREPKPPTITGLALALGFTSRQALLNYQAKDEFVDTITRAKSRVEAYAEARLFDRDGANGAKFSLANNFKGWKEKQSVDFEGLKEATGVIKFEGELDEWSK